MAVTILAITTWAAPRILTAIRLRDLDDLPA
jgi:hypothetical protein